MEGGELQLENGVKINIEGKGKDINQNQLISVTPIPMDIFEKNPKIIFDYDVTVIAKWGKQNWDKFKNRYTYDTILNYIDSGKGLLIDCFALTEIFLIYIGADVKTLKKFGVNYYAPKEMINSDKVIPVKSNSLITKYPNLIENDLNIPFVSTISNFYHTGDIWFSFPEGKSPQSSYFLAIHNNIGLIQTGVSLKMNDDEAKIIANAIYYLKNKDNFYEDKILFKEPDIKTKIDEKNMIITWNDVSYDASYWYKIRAIQKNNGTVMKEIEKLFYTSQRFEKYCFFISESQSPIYETYKCDNYNYITKEKSYQYKKQDIMKYAHIYLLDSFQRRVAETHVLIPGNITNNYIHVESPLTKKSLPYEKKTIFNNKINNTNNRNSNLIKKHEEQIKIPSKELIKNSLSETHNIVPNKTLKVSSNKTLKMSVNKDQNTLSKKILKVLHNDKLKSSTNEDQISFSNETQNTSSTETKKSSFNEDQNPLSKEALKILFDETQNKMKEKRNSLSNEVLKTSNRETLKELNKKIILHLLMKH